MQIGEFAPKFDQRMIGAGDIPRATCARAHTGRGLDHGAEHFGMLAHSQVIVRAPDHDIAWAVR